ncbi:uncharacterized protein LOC124145709 isoform X1 [Haliotis rufescens]|uniref:uncharacterized protein LOC124145709 isoform X1 n=1 Tax=Haliotis rufescens TaxID=6454 RepID=UPI00201ED6E0|nr:uncharacterized protein LOC124145709 isoform X1 [Haliotis rufescens]
MCDKESDHDMMPIPDMGTKHMPRRYLQGVQFVINNTYLGRLIVKLKSSSTMKVLLLVVLVVSLAIMASTAPAKERSLLGDILNKLIPTSGCAVPINCLVPPCPCLIG